MATLRKTLVLNEDEIKKALATALSVDAMDIEVNVDDLGYTKLVYAKVDLDEETNANLEDYLVTI